MIQTSLTEARILDLYAGSGALGIEALSRGASSVTFVERDRRALATLRENLRALGLLPRVTIVADDVARYLRRVDRTFDAIFMDPPYHRQIVPSLLARRELAARLAPGGLVVAEHEATLPLDPPPGWTRVKTAVHGEAAISVLRYEAEAMSNDKGEGGTSL